MTVNSSGDRLFDLDERARAAAESYVDSLDWGNDPKRYSFTRYAIEVGFERGFKQGFEQEFERGLKEGYWQVMLRHVSALMENLSVSAEEAFRMLKVPETEWAELRTKLAARGQTPLGDSAR